MRLLLLIIALTTDIQDEVYAILHPQVEAPDGTTSSSGIAEQIKQAFFGGSFVENFTKLSSVILGIAALISVITAAIQFFRNDRDSEVHFIKIGVGLAIASVLIYVIGQFTDAMLNGDGFVLQ